MNNTVASDEFSEKFFCINDVYAIVEKIEEKHVENLQKIIHKIVDNVERIVYN